MIVWCECERHGLAILAMKFQHQLILSTTSLNTISVSDFLTVRTLRAVRGDFRTTRVFDEPSLDSDPPIGEVLPAGVSNLFLPDATFAFLIKTTDDRGAFLYEKKKNEIEDQQCTSKTHVVKIKTLDKWMNMVTVCSNTKQAITENSHSTHISGVNANPPILVVDGRVLLQHVGE